MRDSSKSDVIRQFYGRCSHQTTRPSFPTIHPYYLCPQRSRRCLHARTTRWGESVHLLSERRKHTVSCWLQEQARCILTDCRNRQACKHCTKLAPTRSLFGKAMDRCFVSQVFQHGREVRQLKTNSVRGLAKLSSLRWTLRRRMSVCRSRRPHVVQIPRMTKHFVKQRGVHRSSGAQWLPPVLVGGMAPAKRAAKISQSALPCNH